MMHLGKTKSELNTDKLSLFKIKDWPLCTKHLIRTPYRLSPFVRLEIKCKPIKPVVRMWTYLMRFYFTVMFRLLF